MQKKAFIYIRKVPPYPYPFVEQGLEKCGYKKNIKYLTQFREGDILPIDLLVTWTLWRHTTKRACADAHHRIRGTTLCMEHGFIRHIQNKEYYQLALRRNYDPGINGSGDIIIGDEHRWDSWKIPLKPWRKTGTHVLVCVQRGVRKQDPDITHGADWANLVFDKIRKHTDRPIHWRPHPGNHRPCLPSGNRVPDKIIRPHSESYEDNLKDAWCTVVYSSTAANQSIISGVPVLFDGQYIMLHKLAGRIKHIENPPMGDRLPELRRKAWAQWSSEELSDGTAFKHILQL